MQERQLNLFGYEKKEGLVKRRQMITLPVDTLVLLSVVMVLLLVIAFSIGVERGRKIAKRTGKEEISTEGTMIALATEEVVKPKKRRAKPKEKVVQKQRVIQPVTKTVEMKEATEKQYLIQVASYLTMEAAEKEAEKLKKGGYPVKIEQKGKYIVLFVGEFSARNRAEDNLQILRKTYHDCFIRRL